MNTITFHCGDIRDIQTTMPDNTVDLVVTSPPFLALRSYLPADHPDKHREIGSEPTPAEFLDTMLELSQEWRRIVTPTGSIAVEIGDTYAGGDNTGNVHPDPKAPQRGQFRAQVNNKGPGWPLAKSLCGIPTLYTWSLAYGHNLLNPATTFAPWRIRNLLVWTRPNPPVGALGDKFRPATSYVTVACTSDKRWFDLDSVRTQYAHPDRIGRTVNNGRHDPDQIGTIQGAWTDQPEFTITDKGGAPPLDWWEHDWQPLHNMPTAPYKGAHYATYPPTLPRRLIEAMCPRQVCTVCGEPRRRIVGEATYDPGPNYRGLGRIKPTFGNHDTMPLQGSVIRNAPTLGWTDCEHNCQPDHYRPGVVLDPFAGSGTTALAAALCGRDAVLIDIDPRNIALTRHRIAQEVQILSETSDGPTTVWTVEHQLPGLKGQADGQLSLFTPG